MKPVYQTKFGATEGNCLAACIASLLETDIDDIPDFSPRPDDMVHWTAHFRKFFKERGLLAEWFNPDLKYATPAGIYYLAWGTSPRGLPHSVIYRNGKLVHDPHPEGGGVNEIESFVVFFRTFD